MKINIFKSLILILTLMFGLSINAQIVCPVIPAPFYEGFNNGLEPQCWDNLSSDPSTSPDNYWNFNDQGDYGAVHNGRLLGNFAKADGSNPNPDSMMLISPEIDLSPLTTPFLSFEWFSNNIDFPGDNNPLIIDVFDGAAWTNLDTLMGDSSAWKFQNYDLTAFMNQTIQVRFMVNQNLTTNHPIYNDILLDEVRIDDCVSTTGQDGSKTFCIIGNTVNLNDSIIVKPNGGGYWSYPSQPGLVNGSYFDVSTLNSGASYDVYYIERLVCYDTTIATISFYESSSAGTAVEGTMVCPNDPVSLFSLLTGYVGLGGTWYDFTGNALSSSLVTAPSILGTYDYTYLIDNANCPDDSTIVSINVIDGCGWWDPSATTNQDFQNISISPNPASNHLKIINSSNTPSLKIEMSDMNGRIVLRENKVLNNAGEVMLMIDHLEKGIYTLRIFNKEEQNVYKIVKH